MKTQIPSTRAIRLLSVFSLLTGLLTAAAPIPTSPPQANQPLRAPAITYQGPTTFSYTPDNLLVITGFDLSLDASVTGPTNWIRITVYRNGIPDDPHWVNSAGRPANTSSISGYKMFIIRKQDLPIGTHALVIDVFSSLAQANAEATPLAHSVQAFTVI